MLDTKNGEYYFIRAQAKLSIGMDKQAKKDAKKAYKLGYKN